MIIVVLSEDSLAIVVKDTETLYGEQVGYHLLQMYWGWWEVHDIQGLELQVPGLQVLKNQQELGQEILTKLTSGIDRVEYTISLTIFVGHVD